MEIKLPIEPGRAIAETETLQLRDLFAAAALVGLLAAPADSESGDVGPNARADYEKAAAWAYDYADAMLAGRAEPTETAP
jgi:hypothetical protein